MFIKYPEINNSYNERNINFWLKIYPEIRNMRFTAEIKLDGSNISTCFQKNQDMKVYSRENRIGPDQNFFDVWNVIKDEKYIDFFTKCYYFVESNNLESLQITGELYGKGIQKRIDYGDKKYIKYFSVRINGILQTPKYCYNFIPDNLLIHVENDNLTFEEALSYDVETLTDYYSPTHSRAEGIVIKPYDNVLISPVKEIFYLKRKNKDFGEKMKVKEDIANKYSDNVIHLNVEYRSFINENRMYNLFSKVGNIVDQSQLGEYIKMLRDDAIKDFMKEFKEDFDALNKKEQKAVFNVGNVIAKMFQNYLFKERS